MKKIQIYQRADTEQGQQHQSQAVLQSVQNKLQNIAQKQDQHQDKPEQKSFRSQSVVRKQNIIFYLLFIIVFFLIGCALYYVLQEQAASLKFKDQKNNKIQKLQQSNSEKFQQKQAIEPKVQIRSQQKQTQIKPIQNNFQQQYQVSKQIKQETGIQSRLFKHEDILNPKITRQLNQLLKDTLYDPHQFIRQDQFCQHTNPVILYLAEQKQQINLERPLLNITKSQEELQKIIENMKYNQDRPKRFPSIKAVTRVSPASIDLAYFFHALNYDPNNPDYLEAQYYRYNKLYSIGNYKKQLPLCITLVGKNTQKYQDKLYSTLQRQNYSNYRIVHIDDNSNDGTQDKIIQMIKQKPQFGKKITFVTQKIRRNQFYNRNMAIRNYCPDDSIVLDLDADDWIIGNQVFQLVNSIYQSGNIYKNMQYDLWALYLGHIIYQPHCPCILPNIDGQIPQKQFAQHTYRSSGKWRTTQLRTFLRKIYLKIDVNDFVDKLSLKGSYYLQSPDAFMHSAILELSGPKHLKFLDQFVYYYTTSLSNMRRRDNSLDIHYAGYTAKTLTPYQNLESLNDTVRRVKNYKVPQNVWNDKQIKTKEMQRRRDKILQQIEEMILNNSSI